MKKDGFISKRLRAWVSPLVVIFCCALGMEAYGKDVDQKMKDFINQTSESLKNGIDSLGDDFEKIQDYLENYSWEPMIQDKESSGGETLNHLKLNNRGKVIVVRPGETVRGEVICSLNSDETSPLKVYRAVIGLYGVGPQITVGTSLGACGGASKEEFILTAPNEPGMYQIRFRGADNFLGSSALESWYDEKGEEPNASTIIGILYVKS